MACLSKKHQVVQLLIGHGADVTVDGGLVRLYKYFCYFTPPLGIEIPKPEKSRSIRGKENFTGNQLDPRAEICNRSEARKTLSSQVGIA